MVQKEKLNQTARTPELTDVNPPGLENPAWTIAAILVIACLTALVYANTLNSPFVLDDSKSILENHTIRISGFSFESVLEIARNTPARPLPALSFALNYYFGRHNPYGYHIFNIIVHMMTGCLLFSTIRATLNLRRNGLYRCAPLSSSAFVVALATACIWSAHPVNTQSVTYIVQRMTSLSALFCLLSGWFYIKSRLSSAGHTRSVLFALAGISWIFALASKQTAAAWPFVLLLYEWFFFQDLSAAWFKKSVRYLAAAVVLFGVLAFFYLGSDPIATLSSLRDFSEARFTLSERVLTQFRVVVYYLSLFYYPHPSRLNLDYDFPLSHSLFDPATTLFSALLLIGLIFAAVLTSRKHRLVSFCILWYFLNLALESTIIPLAIIFEHRTYMPFMGLAFLSVLAIDCAVKPLKGKMALLCLIVAVSSFWTYQRNNTWRDAVTLWQDVVHKAPGKARAHNNLGLAFYMEERTQEAMEHYAKALELEPVYKEALLNMGSALKKLDRIDEALRYFEDALRIDPNYGETLNNMGAIMLDNGRIDEAVRFYEAALQRKPDSAEILNNLGSALTDLGQTDRAVTYFKKVIEIDPTYADALNHLGLAAVSRRDFGEARTLFERALKAAPDNAETAVNLGAVFIHYNQLGAALTHFKNAVRLDPNMASAHTNLGALLIQRGDYQRGLYHIQLAVELEPENELARSNLKRALAMKKQTLADIAALQQSASADPQNPDSHMALADLYQAVGDNHSAITALNAALALRPDSDLLLDRLGNLYLINNDYADALKIFKKHLAVDPDFSLPYYNLARWHAKQGLNKEALAWLEKALVRGYANLEKIASDPELESIRETDAYAKLMDGRGR